MRFTSKCKIKPRYINPQRKSNCTGRIDLTSFFGAHQYETVRQQFLPDCSLADHSELHCRLRMGVCQVAAQRLPCWTSECWARGGCDQIKESSQPGNFVVKARLVLLFPRVLGTARARCGQRSSRSAGHRLCIPICSPAGMPSATPSAPKAVK